MYEDGSGDTQVALSPADRVGHMLIRATNGDGLDPFFVKGHPNWPTKPNQIVLACFYYAIIMTPKVTLMFDNDGRGGMCDLVPQEIAGAWRTEKLLDALGVTFEALQDGTAAFDATSLPEPQFRPDWTEDGEAEETPALAPAC